MHGATPTTASSLRWTKEEQRRTVTVNNVATDFVDRMELGERCLCTSPVKRQGYVRQRNQAGCTGDRNLLHYPPAMPPATLDQYDKLLSAPTPQQRRATAAAAAAKSMMASPRPTFFTDQERGRIQLRSAASTDSAAAACLGTLGTHDSLAIDVWRRRHRDRRTKHQLRSLRDAGPSVSVPNLVSVRERALVQAPLSSRGGRETPETGQALVHGAPVLYLHLQALSYRKAQRRAAELRQTYLCRCLLPT